MLSTETLMYLFTEFCPIFCNLVTAGYLGACEFRAVFIRMWQSSQLFPGYGALQTKIPTSRKARQCRDATSCNLTKVNLK